MHPRARPHRVLLLGGTGFVGRKLTWRLGRDGCTIRIPTRSYARNRDLSVSPDVELVEADVHDEAALSSLLEGCESRGNPQ
jgi:NADH dehydrogenase